MDALIYRDLVKEAEKKLAKERRDFGIDVLAVKLLRQIECENTLDRINEEIEEFLTQEVGTPTNEWRTYNKGR